MTIGIDARLAVSTDKVLLDRIDFLDCLINIEGWEWNVSSYIDEQELIYSELERRTDPKASKNAIVPIY